MPRLSPIDQAFFLLETPERPMNIGVLLMLSPPAGARGNHADRLVRRMLQCPVGPPFNYRLKAGPVPPLLALEVDDHTDARRHIVRHRVRRGSEPPALFRRICEIHIEPLQRDAPLWQMHVFTGFSGGRVALYFKTHHGLIDGLGFIRVMKRIVTDSPNDGLPHAIWEGLPDVARSHASSRPQTAAGLLRAAGQARQTAQDLLRLVWRQGLRAAGYGPGLALPFVSTPDVLKTPPSARRVLAHCALPLTRVRRVAARGNAKVNDVMLAILDAALNRYLAARGTTPDSPLVADVPVALNDDGGTGNRISILQVPMGRPDSSPERRLWEIVSETQTLKNEVRALSADSLTLYSILQHTLASSIESLHLGSLPMLANLVVSNPAGLDRRVYFNGGEVALALPISVVAHHQVLNVTVTTYVDQLHVTFLALADALPDLDRLAQLTTDALDELETDLATRNSGKPRRRSRRTSRRAAAGQRRAAGPGRAARS